MHLSHVRADRRDVGRPGHGYTDRTYQAQEVAQLVVTSSAAPHPPPVPVFHGIYTTSESRNGESFKTLAANLLSMSLQYRSPPRSPGGQPQLLAWSPGHMQPSHDQWYCPLRSVTRVLPECSLTKNVGDIIYINVSLPLASVLCTELLTGAPLPPRARQLACTARVPLAGTPYKPRCAPWSAAIHSCGQRCRSPFAGASRCKSSRPVAQHSSHRCPPRSRARKACRRGEAPHHRRLRSRTVQMHDSRCDDKTAARHNLECE